MKIPKKQLKQIIRSEAQRVHEVKHALKDKIAIHTSEGDSEMKISKRRLKRLVKEERNKLLQEMQADGTISDDEEEAEVQLMMQLEMEMDELLQLIDAEAAGIGGPMRRAGIKSRALRLLADKVHSAR